MMRIRWVYTKYKKILSLFLSLKFSIPVVCKLEQIMGQLLGLIEDRFGPGQSLDFFYFLHDSSGVTLILFSDFMRDSMLSDR